MKEKGYQPFVTILVPIRNVAKYIRECLDHLLAQTYPSNKFEVLILDNQSTDGSVEICKEYEKKTKGKIKILQMWVHSPAKKYNQIIKKVKGEVVGFVDGDANVNKFWLARVIAPLKEKKVAGASGLILTANKKNWVARLIGYELQDRYERMPKKVKRMATMHVVYKKNVLEEIGGFNEKLKTGYDCEIGYRIFEHGYDIINVPKAIAYHNHRESLWGYTKQQFEYGFYAIPRYLERPKIMKGDNVTSFWMIIQPALIALIILLFLLGMLVSYLIYLPLFLSGILILVYLMQSLRLIIKYRDLSAIGLVLFYIIRPIAWGLGGFCMTIRMIKI